MAAKIVIVIKEQGNGMTTHITRRAEGEITIAEGLLSGMLVKVIDFLTAPRKNEDDEDE